MKQKIIFGFICLLIFSAGVAIGFYYHSRPTPLFSPLVNLYPKPTPLTAYTFNALRSANIPGSSIVLGPIYRQTPDSLSQIFYYSTPVKPGSLQMERVSGLMNLPKTPGKYPVIVMLRGYVAGNIYAPGVETQPFANVLVHHGMITLAPDFLGYGQSDATSPDPFESRFQTYTTALSLFASLPTLNAGLSASYSASFSADLKHVGVWGHSNGGQIALSVAAISGFSYPTVLWAPVSKSFPYSILYYTDESDDQGKGLRQALTNFEANYDTESFSPPNYYDWIKAPIHVDQGTGDQEVPIWWSDELVKTLKKNGDSVTYSTYPGADHNLRPAGWAGAVTTDLKFYQAKFSN